MALPLAACGAAGALWSATAAPDNAFVVEAPVLPRSAQTPQTSLRGQSAARAHASEARPRAGLAPVAGALMAGLGLSAAGAHRRARRHVAARATAVADAPPTTSSPASGRGKGKTAIVVGGGVGGLATAAQLSKNGMTVSLYEKNEEMGGRCQSVESKTAKGYRWDTGPSLLLLPEKYNDAYKRLGTDMKKELNLKRVDPPYRVVFGDDTHIDVDYDPIRMTEQMEKFEPGVTSNYYRFLSVARRMLDMGVERFVDRQFETWPELVDPIGLLPQMLLRGWITIPLFNMLGSMDSLVKAWFQDERLRSIFTFQTLYVGLTPYNSPGALCLLAGTDLTDGVWYPMGGWQNVKNSLIGLAEKHGVSLNTKADVDEVIVEGGKAVGIRMADGTEKRADVVVVNQDLPLAYRTVLRNADKGLRPDQKEEKGSDTPVEDFGKDWNKKDYSCGVIAFYWAVDKKVDYLSHHSIFLGAGGGPRAADEAWMPITSGDGISKTPNFYVHCPSRTDPTACPEGCESIMTLFPVANMQEMAKEGKFPTGTKGEMYADIKAAARETILRRFKEAGCGDLSGNIVEEFVRDPEDFKELYSLEHGATFSLSHGLLQLAMTRPPPRSSEVESLFFVGAGTRPGNGVPLVLMGAGLTSEQILEDIQVKASSASA